MKTYFTLLIGLILSGTISSQTFSILADQDVFFLDASRNEDRNYTQGTAFVYSNEKLFQSTLFYPLRFFNERIRNNQVTPIGSSLGIYGTAFTPLTIDSVMPIIGDRPFAFLLGLSASQINEMNSSARRYEAISLNVGVLGTKVAYNFQGWAHKNIIQGRPTNPIGWDTQISRGGGITGLFDYSQLIRYRLCTSKKSEIVSSFGFDGLVNYGGSFGYYDRFYGGTMVRLGWLNPAQIVNWALFSNTLSNGAMLNTNKTVTNAISTTGCTYDYTEFFVYGRATGTLMGRNTLLEGQWITNKHEYTLKREWVNIWLAEFEVGACLGFNWLKQKGNISIPKTIRVQYKNTFRTPEFDSGIFPKRCHYFGSANIQFSI